MAFLHRTVRIAWKRETSDQLASLPAPHGSLTTLARTCLGALSLLVLGSAALAAAQGYAVERVAVAVPAELSAAVRETLAGEALRVAGPNGTMCEIWLRKVVPVQAHPVQELGINYGQLAEGTLVGAVRFAAEVKDYRRQRVKPGTYTLRYALIPVDGNHQGVAPNRDFLLISPAATDADAALISRDALLNLSRKASGTSHPSAWSLPAVEEQPPTLPAMVHREDGGLWVLQFRAQTQAGAVVMALVVVGSAPEA